MEKWARVLFVLIFMMTFPAYAREVIHSFDVNAQVFASGEVLVREDITVTAENDQIRHGIYRDFPTDYTDRMGNRVRVIFNLDGIFRDGSPEPYHINSLDNGLRVYIGDADTYVSGGKHRYTLAYSVQRVMGFFDTYDEFYWNVTGNGWVFPIEKASIRIEFPIGAEIGNYAGYTGAFGAQGKAYRAGAEENIFMAETTVPLSAYEGFTVAAAIPKGFVHAPTEAQKLALFLKDNRVWVIFFASSVFLFVFLFVSWWKKGRDSYGTIIPRFDVPEGISPDLLRFVVKQGYDTKTLTCFILDAAVKGYLRIEDNEDETVIRRTGKLSYGVLNILSIIFGREGRLVLPKSRFFKWTNKSSRQERKELALLLQSVQDIHEKNLKHPDYDPYFSKNAGILLAGFIIMLFSFSAVFGLSLTQDQRVYACIATFLVQVVLLMGFGGPLRKYTQKGDEIANYAAGLKMFLSVAEEARMNALYPKTITPEKFEQMLPYALALGVEQKWCEYFAGLVKDGLAQYDEDRSDYWYHSHDRSGISLAALGNSLGANLTSAISSASTPPGSSSGSGGGGSSGGGGGGGGGGGW
jgi:uncharacterized membrane protein YgcG